MTSATAPQMLAIGDLAAKSGLAVSAIRYYEEIGLIPKATRRPSGHRAYPAGFGGLLTLIRRCRDFGFSLDDTKALASLASSADRDCAEARDVAQSHLDSVRTKMAELKALERSLAEFVTSCDEGCAGGPAPECSILKDLGASASKPAPRSAPGARKCCG